MKDTGALKKHVNLLGLPKKTLSSSDLTTTPAPLHIPFNRKNLGAVGLRKWVKFDKNGETSVVQADKHNLTQQLGVQVLSALQIWLEVNLINTVISPLLAFLWEVSGWKNFCFGNLPARPYALS